MGCCGELSDGWKADMMVLWNSKSHISMEQTCRYCGTLGICRGYEGKIGLYLCSDCTVLEREGTGKISEDI